MTREVTKSELKDLFILRRVSGARAISLLTECPVIEMERGQILLKAGQSNQKLYIILSGTLSVHLESPDRAPVAILDAGETVGELSVIDDSPATAFVVASEPSRVLELSEAAFWDLVSFSHAFACNMLMILSERIRHSDAAITRNVRMRRRFEKDALLDSLTGLKNRRWIDSRLPRLLDRHQRSGLPLTLVMFDVDHFKNFNDEYGHEAGDTVLASVASSAMDCLRPTDLCARYGGEEFLVILTGIPKEIGLSVAERIRQNVKATDVETDDGRKLPPVTVSLGIAEARSDDVAAILIKRADSAMYRAKTSGRNRTCMEDTGTEGST
ncbi:MAG: hypothetical protein AVO35_00440 [Candidatus Aegiribacteria sp. MLS_C]|nr:MAG: hypothetical protein AVO35_00440 [Candidatus Aegiribacteria sp. MLS_C]